MAKEKYTEHPSIAVIGGNPKLRVFEDFFIEEDLPKWKKIAVKLKDDGDRCVSDSFRSISNNGSIQDGRSDKELLSNAKFDRRHYVDAQADRRSIIRTAGNSKKRSFFAGVFEKINALFDRGIPVESAFQGIKDSVAYPTNEDLLAASKLVDALISRSNAAGQYEIANRIKGVQKCLEAEVVLVKNKMLRYLTEDQVIKFMLMSEKGIRMEYLRYYNDILPSQVAAQKIAADSLLVFDNYCVLYYDDDTKKFSLIKEAVSDRERERRRDPILFGLIKGSRKLYYITDWITEDDDLTLDKLQKVIGETAMDVSEAAIADTQYTAASLLERLVNVDVQTDVEIAAARGLLITEENFEHFLKTGEVADSMRNAVLPEVVPGTVSQKKNDEPKADEPDVEHKEMPPAEKK